MVEEKILIRYAEINDKDFWFTVDKHLPFPEFERKVRDKRCYILFADGRAAGILRYNLFWDNTPFCNLLFVSEEYRNRGFGKRLMEYWEKDMVSLGYSLLLTSTRSDENAQYFYRALGYSDCGNMTVRGQPDELFLSKHVVAAAL